MKVLLQRVTSASVVVAGADAPARAIGAGLVVFVCIEAGDSDETCQYMARKVANLRVFADQTGKTNHSLLDTGGAALVVSQFTLGAEWKKGNRPGFSGAADPGPARQLYGQFCHYLRAHGVGVETGEFAADMAVSLTNDGPFTLFLDTNA